MPLFFCSPGRTNIMPSIWWPNEISQIPLDYVLIESREVNITLWQDDEWKLLSISCECELFLTLFPIRGGQELTQQLNGHIPHAGG